MEFENVMMRKNRFLLKMVGKTRKLSIAKYLFFVLLILCLTVVSTVLYFSDSTVSQNEDSGFVEYVKILSPEFSKDMLDSKFEACFFSNTLNSTYSSSAGLNLGTASKARKIKKHDLINILIQFANISHELGIKPVLIEPSLLFCILSPSLKSLLLKRNFKVEKRSSERVMTIGIFQKDAVILEKEDVQNRLAKIGFQIEIVDAPILKWMKYEIYRNRSMFTSHVFLRKEKWILHLVVFHERHNFLWHSALLSQVSSRKPTKERFLFVEADAAFENFTAVSLGIKTPLLENVYVPTNPANFLHQISTSRFLDCNDTIVNLFKRQPVSNLSTHHQYSKLTLEEFNQRLLITLEELKLKLHPMLISFWVWSGTLLGLHRQCDVISYTSDADFAVWEADDEDVNKIIKVFKHNEHLTIREKLGMAEEGLELKLKCHGLMVDLFFVYKQNNGTWYAGHSPKKGYYFKYHHPTFSLCSAELLGHKVNTPCEPESVISSEYGSKWIHPVSSWNFERSAHNRGPNIFWKKSLLRKVHKHF